ncbi:unnamed protein product [Penicillium camemberti]|uniref:Str. FM013 n=1 Tax=Penicillium camemberti (strain FM 013) TaxID=1429867 RepID=A0A0G4PPJ9_PENC3|nr:unnamed protein product [Penicillium camemberti]
MRWYKQCKVPCLVCKTGATNSIPDRCREMKPTRLQLRERNMLQLEGLGAASRPDRNNRFVLVEV